MLNFSTKWKKNRLTLFVSGCLLLVAACGSKTAGTHTAAANTTGGEQPHAAHLLEPDDSLKYCDPDSLDKRFVDGAERWFYKDTLMNGAYKSPYFEDTELYHSVTTYRQGVRNDTVRHYHATHKWLVAEVVKPDSIHKIYQGYYSNGNPRIRYETTRGRLDGIRQRWFFDGKPDKLEHFKDGVPEGEEKNWYPNGYLASVYRYAGGKQVGPNKSWYYSKSKDDMYYHLGATEAPDRQAIEYDLGRGYRLEEFYKAADGGEWLLSKRSFSERDKEVCSFEKSGCDSVRRDTVSDGARLEVRDYRDGRLQSLENYPLGFGNGPLVATETYGEAGQLVEKHFYDDELERLEPVRVYAQAGAVVTDIGFDEYERLVKDSCNVYLAPESPQWAQKGSGATLQCRGKSIELVGSSDAGSDSEVYCQWSYNGYNARSGLHFFGFEGFEVWGYFVADEANGQVTAYEAAGMPVFCGRSDLFFVEDANPHVGSCAAYIYRQLPGGRLARVAMLDRGGVNFYSLDLENFIWVGERTMVATKIGPERRDDRYYSEDDRLANEGREPYVRIEILPEALQNMELLPFSDEVSFSL